MEIIFLGAGDAFTTQNYQTNLLLRFDNTNLLIDCGTSGLVSLRDYGVRIPEIQNIFVTHLHADHVGGLDELAFQLRYVYKSIPHLYSSPELLHELWEHKLRGGMAYTVDGIVSLDFYFQIHPVEHKFSIGSVNFELIPTLHIPAMKSHGLLFNRVWYSSDTVFNEDLILQMAERADIIIHECCFYPVAVHTYFEYLLQIPLEIRQRMYLLHYNDDSEKMLKYMEKQGFHCVRKHLCLQIDNRPDGKAEIVCERRKKSRWW